MKPIVVLYHSNCFDGFGAAYAAWRKFGNKASYIPVDRGQPLPEELSNRTVYSLDFTYREPLLSKLLKIAKSVVFIDHHASEKENIKRGSDWIFALDHSGAVLAWKYFHKKKPVPKLLAYIEDRDIWKFKLPKSDELSAFLDTVPFNFKYWNTLVKNFDSSKGIRKYIEKGRIILDYQNSLLKRLEKKAVRVKFKGFEVMAVNSPLLHSDIGHILAEKNPPFSIIWHQSRPDRIKVSLRASGKFDVSKIAENYGGGGHKAAAAFFLPAGKKLPWKFLK